MKEYPLSEVLTKYEEKAELSPDATYKQVTVRLHGKGVVERGEVAGLEAINKPYFMVREGQFILSRIDARNGAFGLVPASLNGAIVSRDFPSFEINQSLLLPGYMLWLSRTPAFIELCQQASEGTTNRVRLQENRFLRQTIMLPPLAEQRRIVGRIEELAGKVEEARRLRDAAIEETNAIMGVATHELLSSIVNRQEIPLEEVCTDIVDCLHSNPIYSDSGIPTLRSPDVGWGDLNLGNARCTDEVEYIRRTSRGKPQKDDIIFVREGGGVGKAGITLENQQFSLGQRVMMLRPNQALINPQFFLYQLLSPLVYQEQIMSRLKGSASPHLNIKTLRRFSLIVPSLSEQQEIVNVLGSIKDKTTQIKRLQATTQQELDALLPSMLDKAFKGEL
ncbi:MAG: restriction endonuclease subunit S [Chloroflexi bacterium]|nr:restriction endonuclease subunit S [Chloroflexota bacterium]MBP8058460.1 restriction endonuclease subunit S [Chloroflexota bacterium]